MSGWAHSIVVVSRSDGGRRRPRRSSRLRSARTAAGDPVAPRARPAAPRCPASASASRNGANEPSPIGGSGPSSSTSEVVELRAPPRRRAGAPRSAPMVGRLARARCAARWTGTLGSARRYPERPARSVRRKTMPCPAGAAAAASGRTRAGVEPDALTAASCRDRAPRHRAARLRPSKRSSSLTMRRQPVQRRLGAQELPVGAGRDTRCRSRPPGHRRTRRSWRAIVPRSPIVEMVRRPRRGRRGSRRCPAAYSRRCPTPRHEQAALARCARCARPGPGCRAWSRARSRYRRCSRDRRRCWSRSPRRHSMMQPPTWGIRCAPRRRKDSRTRRRRSPPRP